MDRFFTKFGTPNSGSLFLWFSLYSLFQQLFSPNLCPLVLQASKTRLTLWKKTGKRQVIRHSLLLLSYPNCSLLSSVCLLLIVFQCFQVVIYILPRYYSHLNESWYKRSYFCISELWALFLETDNEMNCIGKIQNIQAFFFSVLELGISFF